MDVADLKKKLMLVPILLAIHNIEEAVTMPAWMADHGEYLKSAVPLFQHLNFSSTQLYVSLVNVTIIPAAAVFLLLRKELTQRKILAVLFLQSVIFFNALIPHIIGLPVLGMYNPGTISAVLINLPFSIYLFVTVYRAEILPLKSLLRISLYGLILYLPIVYLNHLLAHGISGLM